MTYLRHILVLFLVFLACAKPDTTLSPEMQTTAKGHFITRIINDIRGWHNREIPDCQFSKVLSSRVVEKNAEKIVESWVIEACNGKHFEYKITIKLVQPDNLIQIDGIR